MTVHALSRRSPALVGFLAALWGGCGDPDQGGDSIAAGTESTAGTASTASTTGSSDPTGSGGGTTGSTGSDSDTAAPTSGQASTTTSAGTTGTSTSTGVASDGTSSGGSTSTGDLPCPDTAFCADATEDGTCRRELTLPDGNRLFYWSNLSLEPGPDEAGCNANIDRAVVVQHGTSRNPWSYFNTIMEAAGAAGVDGHTLIVAPWFPADEDDPPDGFARWEPGGSGWKSGDDSTTAPPVSSFSVYDHLLAAFVLDPSLHPQLADLVVTGHSAGAQFVQRYAVTGDLGGADPGPVTLRWIVANPSSYLYLDPYRWDGLGVPPAVDFAIPAGTDCDDDYDDFKYGLSAVPAGHYVSQHLGGIPSLYLGRDVTYLLGEDDDEMDADLDITCPATLQGAHRFERGLVFTGFLDARFPAQDHATVTVPGVGHSQSGMYTSPEGIAALFP